MSKSGGKAKKRNRRLPTTTKGRLLSQPPPTESPSWFSGRILPHARAIASGVRNTLARVLYPEFSSSSKDEDKDSGSAKDGLDANDGVKASHESERKLLIKQLIEQETFSRDENYEMDLLVYSRVPKPIKPEKRPATSPGQITEDEAKDMLHKTVLKAKKEYLEAQKKGPSGTGHVLEVHFFLKDSKVGQIDCGSCTLKLPCPASSKSEELHSDEEMSNELLTVQTDPPTSIYKRWLIKNTQDYLDSLEIGQVRKFLVELRTYLKTNKPQFQEIISSTKTFTEEAEVLLKEAIQEHRDRFLLQEQA